jgi:hypothetical protein
MWRIGLGGWAGPRRARTTATRPPLAPSIAPYRRRRDCLGHARNRQISTAELTEQRRTESDLVRFASVRRISRSVPGPADLQLGEAVGGHHWTHLVEPEELEMGCRCRLHRRHDRLPIRPGLTGDGHEVVHPEDGRDATGSASRSGAARRLRGGGPGPVDRPFRRSEFARGPQGVSGSAVAEEVPTRGGS